MSNQLDPGVNDLEYAWYGQSEPMIILRWTHKSCK
jgi:hypothetical protein